jgi:hypothetical protein
MKTENKKEMEKTNIVETFFKKFGTSLEEFKYKVAKMSIDMSGTLEQEYNVLFRVIRGCSPTLEYSKDWVDGNTTNWGFWFAFQTFFYRDMPSGYYVRQTLNGNHYLVDANDKLLQKIEENDLMNDLIDDLVKRDYNEFNDTWNEFIEKFQKWLEVE